MDAILFYDTRTRTKRRFEPIVPGRVGIYTCGPTVYGPPHLGNLLGAIDPDTGRVWCVVDDVHPRQRELDRHPDIGLPLHRTLPEWTTLRATVLAAAELFPASPCLAFDVALADDGPTLVGMADGVGDPLLLQLAHDRGLDDQGFIGDLQPASPPRRAA